MADPIQLLSAVKSHKDLSHQIAAWRWLQEYLSTNRPEALSQFAELFRADPPIKPEVSPSPGVDWLSHCLPLVKEFEGCRLVAYPDPGTGGDPWTVGYGHTGPDVRQGVTWTQQQAEDSLCNDLREAHAGMLQALPMAAGFTGPQQAALTSWVFNVGAGAAADSTLRRRLAAGERPSQVVAEELPRWNKGGSGVLAGLVRRRAAEVDLFCGKAQEAAAAVAEEPSWPAGMVGPQKRPDLKAGDHHLIADDRAESLTAYTHYGRKLWSVPCLCRGQGAEAEWNTTGSDTPPGLYKVGAVYRDYEKDPTETFSPDRRAYGWYSFDLEGLEGQEGPGSKNGRDGIMIHGGGSGCGWPGAWAPRQALHPTLGCIRCHNQDLRERILPLLALGTIWVSVLQERA
jgi:GH24 family phage-related lysozyme (muramidase)